MKPLTRPDSIPEKNLTDSGLTDYDICELYIKCVETFAQTCSKLDIEGHRCFELGQVLWEKTVEARNEYRKGHSEKTLSGRS